jgi:hypothetical protein
MQVFEDYRSANKAYMKALADDPTREVGIWRNRENNKYVLSYGNPTRVEGPSSTVEKAFELVKHHHPGEPVAAAITDRVPSSEDFEALMAPRHAQIDNRPARSMITWVDESGTMHYTTFGMDPTEVEMYWVRYTDESGQVVTKRLSKAPWSEGKVDYVNWIESLKNEAHGPSTFRP